MTSKDFSIKYLLSCLEISQLLESESGSSIWFAHLNLHDFTEVEIPDGGKIADYLLSEMDLQEVQFFLLLIERKRLETWTENSEQVSFQELIEIKLQKSNHNNKNATLKKQGSVWKNKLDPETLKGIIVQNPDAPLESVAKNRHAVIVNPEQSLRLEVLNIPKPWGHEGWYTGVEKRGVVKVTDEYGKTELPYALNIFKKQVLADHPESLILLKTLNPVSEDVIGDLYYEMHEKKWEVYVVTEIDQTAWPSGTGIIKAGLHPEKIKDYQEIHGSKWVEILLKNFRETIGEYEKIRRQIDDSTEDIPNELHEQELKLRQKASNFVGDCQVKVGDIISFPVFQMHSLRHGIKVIEFQTPHYERLILMFAQKVLTQNHWDTDDALNKMLPVVYEPPELECLHKSSGLLIERFVDFPQFTADRICLEPETIWEDQLDGKYHLLITISGQASIIPKSGSPVKLNREEALFLPVGVGSYRLESTGEIPLICLKAIPK